MQNHPAEPTDHDLLREYTQSGSQAAFAELVARHVDLVYAAARRQLPGDAAHLAEDVTQAVFLVLATKARAGAIAPGTVLAGWLHHATRYAAANAKKIEARRRHHELKGTLMTRPTPSRPAGAHDQGPTWDDLAPDLDAALARLARADRDAVLLKFIQGKSHRDVGAALGISEEAARKRVSRALDRLRELLVRPGIALPATALATLLTAHASEAAPASLSTACGVAPTLAVTSSSALAKSTLSTLTCVKLKLTAALVAASLVIAGGAGYTAHALRHPARPLAQAPVTPPTPAPIVQVLAPAAPANTNLIEGTIVRPDGEPLVDVDVYLATPQNGINLYTHRQPTRQLQITEPDGKFSFPRPKDDLWKVVAMNTDGVAEVTMEDLAKSPLVTLQPWGRIEGTLFAGTKPIPGGTVSVGEWGWGNDPMSTIVTSQTTVKTDNAGHFVIPRVPPGAPLLSQQEMRGTLMSDKWECVSVAPGQTLKVDLGAAGRPVVGKVTVPAGYEDKVRLKTDKTHFWEISARLIKPLDFLGGVNPQMGGMPLPPGWYRLSPREQSAYRRNWDRSPAGIAYRRVMFADEITIGEGGTFRFDALRPGRYALNIRCLVLVREQNMLEDVAGASQDFTVPALPQGQKVTDEPVDLGSLALKAVPRVLAGEKVPPFHVTSVDQKPVSLDDYKGKFLVLQVRWPNLPDQETPGLKKAYEAFAHDPNFAMLTLHVSMTPADPNKIDPTLKWPQAIGSGFIGDPDGEKPSLLNPNTWLGRKPASGPSDAIPREYLQGPACLFLIGPDGRLITKILRGDDVETTVAKALLERR